MLDVKFKLRPGHTSERAWMNPSPLKTLFWNITYACNFRCQVCFSDADKRHPHELTTQEAMEVVRKARAAGISDLLISGGEPLVRQDLIDILAFMKSQDISARIASNGALLTGQIVERLREETLTKSFQISLDSIDPETYEEVHGAPPDTLYLVLDNIDRIQKAGFHTTVSIRLTPQTVDGIPQLLDLAARKGWATVTIHWPVHIKRIQRCYGQNEDFLALLDPAFKHFCELPQHWLVETYIPWAEYHPVIQKFAKKLTIINRGCRAGRDRLTLSATGWLSPCVCLDVEQAYAGNVRRDDLTEVFLNSPVCDMFRQPEKYGICRDCFFLKKCGGGCRAAAFASTRRLDAQDESCPVWKRREGKE